MLARNLRCIFIRQDVSEVLFLKTAYLHAYIIGFFYWPVQECIIGKTT